MINNYVYQISSGIDPNIQISKIYIQLKSFILYLRVLLFLDDNVNLETEEINFGFKVWSNFKESIVGYRTAVSTIISP